MGMIEFIITCQSELQKDGSYKIERYRELVRCKDCKRFDDGICELYGFRRENDYYCADGERKEGR